MFLSPVFSSLPFDTFLTAEVAKLVQVNMDVVMDKIQLRYKYRSLSQFTSSVFGVFL